MINIFSFLPHLLIISLYFIYMHLFVINSCEDYHSNFEYVISIVYLTIFYR